MEITKETSAELKHGHVTVGTTRRQLTVGSFTATRGVFLRAPGPNDPTPNTVPVWVGGPSVAANNSASGGIPLLPGTAIEIPVERTDLLYLISIADGQDLAWMAL